MEGVKSSPNVSEEGQPSPINSDSQQSNQKSRIEAESLGKRYEQNQEQEDDEESVLIRRVGFVFLAYNVEFWCVEHFFHAQVPDCRICNFLVLGTGNPLKCSASKFLSYENIRVKTFEHNFLESCICHHTKPFMPRHI